MAPEALRLAEVDAFYGDSHVLHGVSFACGAGRLVGLLGRNGAGKTTSINVVMGLLRPRRGTIAVKGRVRDFAGLQMKGGTIVLMGGAEIRTGAWMVRGTIVSLAPVPLLPTFARACGYNPVFLRLYAKELRAYGFGLPVDAAEGSYERYTGDTSVPGKGEILVWQGRRP